MDGKFRMFESLPGFRDFYPEQCAVRNHIFKLWKKAARSHSFSEYDVPILEPLDLYIEKSGEEIVGQLFNFTDKGGRDVALRPELTPSLARLIGSRAASLKKPVKWFCIGENFRYERPQKGRLRSHYQFNADIFGEADASADAELIALCIRALTIFGLGSDDFVIRLSDRNIWIDFLAHLGIDGKQAIEVLSIIDKIEREDKEQSLKKLKTYFGEATEEIFKQIETLVGVRTLEDFRSFILSQSLVDENRDKIEARLGEWKKLFDYLNALQLTSYIQIDFGIVRGLAYYTGFVFEAFEKSGKSRSLAGGGRYDHLVKKLGGPELSATGFGMGDVTLTDFLIEKELLSQVDTTSGIYIIIGGEVEREKALASISFLRERGYAVDYSFKNISYGKQFKLADQSGARLALIYGAEEVTANRVKIRDLSTGSESEVPDNELELTVKKYFEN